MTQAFRVIPKIIQSYSGLKNCFKLRSSDFYWLSSIGAKKNIVLRQVTKYKKAELPIKIKFSFKKNCMDYGKKRQLLLFASR